MFRQSSGVFAENYHHSDSNRTGVRSNFSDRHQRDEGEEGTSDGMHYYNNQFIFLCWKRLCILLDVCFVWYVCV